MISGSFRDALGEELLAMGQAHDSLVVVTPDLAKAVRIMDYKKCFPERFITTGISEADCVTVAAGLAATGLTPIVVAFAMFAVVKPYEQIRNAIAYPNLNVKIFATHGGLCVGRDGATHQAIEDLAIMRALPNFTVLTAADAVETKAAMKAAYAHPGPVYLRLGRDQAETIEASTQPFRIGHSHTLAEGRDVTLIACGLMVAEAIKAAALLRQNGIAARVINMYSIKPLDAESVILSASETGAIVTAEDHSVVGGLGGAVAEILVRNVPVPMEFVGVEDQFGESGSQAELYEKYGLTAAKIAAAAVKAIVRKNERKYGQKNSRKNGRKNDRSLIGDVAASAGHVSGQGFSRETARPTDEVTEHGK